jgi:hypothetical protein
MLLERLADLGPSAMEERALIRVADLEQPGDFVRIPALDFAQGDDRTLGGRKQRDRSLNQRERLL